MIDVSKLFYERYCYYEACTRPNVYDLKYAGESGKSLLFCDQADGTDLLFFPEIQLSPFFLSMKKER